MSLPLSEWSTVFRLICNSRGADQRLEIIREIAENGNMGDWVDFEAVPYDDHIDALIWFRDPYKLYNFKNENLRIGK